VDADVVIAGAGPTGLMLACELHLAGVRPVVLERLAEPTGLSKALALVGRSVDALDYRGLLGRFQARAAPGVPNAAHFALIPLDLQKAGDLGLRALFIQQAATEEVLNEYARELGVEIRRGHELTGMHQDAEGVNVQFGGPQGHGELRARYLAGCDGATSNVRRPCTIAPGACTRYDPRTAAPHPLAGRWAPDLALTTPAGASSIAELMRPARGVLIDLTDGGAFAGIGDGWKDRVDLVTAHATAPPRRRSPHPARRVRGLGHGPRHLRRRRAAPGPHHLVWRPGPG
jgi:2-polyprenyl-6-methoxyphenol hydroxylase-like FAD-dependent oxidoreductase